MFKMFDFSKLFNTDDPSVLKKFGLIQSIYYLIATDEDDDLKKIN